MRVKTNDGDECPDNEDACALAVRDDGHGCEVLLGDPPHCADADDARHEHACVRVLVPHERVHVRAARRDGTISQ